MSVGSRSSGCMYLASLPCTPSFHETVCPMNCNMCVQRGGGGEDVGISGGIGGGMSIFNFEGV